MALCSGNCIEKCALITAACLVTNSITTIPQNDATALNRAIRGAQLRYIIPVLKSGCFDELCNALYASNLPNTDDNYKPLETRWADLMEYITFALVATASLLYWKMNPKLAIETYGDNDGVTRITSVLEDEVSATMANLRNYYASKTELFDCLPSEEDCPPDDYMGVDMIDFFSTKSVRKNWNVRRDY